MSPRSLLTVARILPLLLLTLPIHGCSNGPPPGSAAPSYSAVDASGRDVSLAALNGKVVVLDFWATWCAPCRIVSPAMQQLHEEFAADDDVVVLGVHYDDGGDPAAYLAEHGYTFPTIPDGTNVVRRFGVSKIPTIMVLDRQGVVVHNQLGFSQGDEGAIARLVRAHQ